MKYPAMVLTALAALAGTPAQANNFVTITPTGAAAATVTTRWTIGGNQTGLGYIDGDSGFPFAAATNFFTLTGAAIPLAGDPAGFISYLPTGVASLQGSVGNTLTPNSYSGLTYVAENLGLIGPLSLYTIHHRATGDYLALIQPAGPTVSDQKPMSIAGGPLTPGVSGYFGLSYAADNPGGWGAQLFYYLRTNGLGETIFGSLIPALLSGPTDRWNLGANRGFTDLTYTSTDPGFGFGASQFYYLRKDPVTLTTFFGHLNPATGVATDIQNLGGVFRTLVFTPTNVGYGANNFYSISAPAQTITFAPIPNHTACDAPFTFVVPVATSGLPVTLVASGPASVSAGNVVTLTGATGLVTLTASQAGDLNFPPAPSVPQSFNVTACPPPPTLLLLQTITFAAVPAHELCDGAFHLTPTATSGLAVTLAVTSGPATVVGNTVTLTGTGSVTLQAIQAGNGIYASAVPVSQTFIVAECAPVLLPQTITFAPVPNHGLCDGAFSVNPTASSALPVTLGVVSGPATITGNIVTLTGEGTVTLRATQAGNGTYLAATTVTRTFTAAKCAATVTLQNLTNLFFDHDYNALEWITWTTSPAGLPVIVTYNGSTSVPAAVRSYTVVGTINSPLYSGTVTNTLVISGDPRIPQTLSFGGPIADHVFGDAPFTLNPISSSGQPVVLAVKSGPATVSGNTVTLTGPGTVVLELTQAGNIATTLFASLTQSFNVTSSRIVNFSARALAGPDNPFIMGFVVSGEGKSLLIRGVGPTLAAYGLSHALADPLLTVTGAGATTAINDDWQVGNNGALVAATALDVGAFALANGSKDSALLVTLNQGAYGAGISPPDGNSGIALAEIYDLNPAAAARLLNVSARIQVGTGDSILIAGFTIAGNAPRMVLVRAVGPTLSLFGVTGVLANPEIRLYAGENLVAANNDWETGNAAAQMSATFMRGGAFALPAGSKDAALAISLAPGAYTVHVSGVAGTTGVALVEIYDLP